MNITVANKNDNILIHTKSGGKISGIVKETTEDFIIIQPHSKNCIAVIGYKEIEFYLLSNDNITDYLKNSKLKEKVKSITELKEQQKELEIQGIKEKMKTFEPTNYQVEYSTPSFKK